MKYLLVLIVVLFGVGMWRSNRLPKKDAVRKAPVPDTPQDMIACKLCSLHVPRAEAVQGQLGLYCGNEHRHRAED